MGLVIMAVIMTMIVPVIVPVIMTMIVAVIVPVIVPVALARIGAALWIEGCVDFAHTGTEPDKHGANDMITADADRGVGDFSLQMPVAELPGDGEQMAGVLRRDLVERLGLGEHADDPAIVEDKAVAMAQTAGHRQVKQEGNRRAGGQPIRGHEHPPTVAGGLVERDVGYGRGEIPDDGRGYELGHAITLAQLVLCRPAATIPSRNSSNSQPDRCTQAPPLSLRAIRFYNACWREMPRAQNTLSAV